LTEIEINKLREECGVFGIYGHPDASRLTYLGLYALQHRGQESCGIVASDGSELRLERAMGHVSESFDQATLDRLRGPNAIGHVMVVWNPAARTTIEAHDRKQGTGHFTYTNGPRHHIFEIWRVANLT